MDIGSTFAQGTSDPLRSSIAGGVLVEGDAGYDYYNFAETPSRRSSRPTPFGRPEPEVRTEPPHTRRKGGLLMETSDLAGERLRIARELHDVVSYSFATISVQAGVAAHVAEQRPEQAAEALRAIKEISGDACRELRGIVGLLRAPGYEALPKLGVGRLGALAATTTSAGLPTRVVVSGPTDRLSPAVDAAAYRIVQESLTNALRHAGPASASVCVTCEPDRVVVEIVDDGCGLTGHTPARSPGSGHGIAGMRERAEALGGTLDAGPGTEGGFHVRACLPNGGRP